MKTDGLDNSEEPDSDVIEEPGSVESVEFIVFLPCKDQWLSKDQVYYTQELEKFEEIERVENLWINAKPNYEVGTYLKTELKLRTRYANRLKNNNKYRQSIWDRLGIKETCPE